MAKCSKCGKLHKREQRYCKECHAEYMRIWRKTHKMSEEQRQKDNCRSYANVYLRRGKIKKQDCEVCGDKNTEMHHDDYSKPLEVRWFCKKHHQEITNEERETLNGGNQ